MKAVRWHARGDVRVDDVTAPGPPRHDEIQVEVAACGICGTDVEEMEHGPLFVFPDPHPRTGQAAPVILGHEFAGLVVAVGDGVTDREPGQLVAVSPDDPCGSCPTCHAGRGNLCPDLTSHGLSANGGLTEIANVKAAATVPVSSTTSPEAAALVEPLAVALAALRQGNHRTTDRVAVVGGGTIGLLTVAAVSAAGGTSITLLEPIAVRRQLGSLLGTTSELETDDGLAGAADLVIECSGTRAGFATAIKAADRGARVVIVGLHPTPVELDALSVVSHELEIKGSLSYLFEPDFVTAAELISTQRVRPELLITRRVALDRTVEDGLRALRDNPAEHVKVIVEPQADR